MNPDIMDTTLDKLTLVAFDLETTGFSPRTGDEIVEIGALKIHAGEIVDEFHTLVNPLRRMNPGASAVNGITDDMLRDAPIIESIFPQFLEFIGDFPLIIHNAAFDLPFIAWKTAEMGLPRRDNIVFDTMLISRSLHPEFYNHKLYGIVDQLNLQIEPAHRAVEDAFAAWMIFKLLLAPLSNHDPLTINRVVSIQRGKFNWPIVELQTLSPSTPLEIWLQQAIDSQCIIRIKYCSAYNDQPTVRDILPQHITRRCTRTYLIAHCHLRNEQRMFRTDRMERM